MTRPARTASRARCARSTASASAHARLRQGRLANSAFRARLERTAGTTTTRTDVTARENGLRVGAGVEQMLGTHAYAKGEYRYTSYGDGVSRHQALAGVGYRF